MGIRTGPANRRTLRERKQERTKNRLQGQPLQLLELLLEHPGQLVTREQIQQHLWPDGTVVEFEHSVNAAVKRLRIALEDDAEKPRFVETIPRRGYRFIARVSDGRLATGLPSAAETELIPPRGSTRPAVSSTAGLPAAGKSASARTRVVLPAVALVAIFVVSLVLNRRSAAGHNSAQAVKSLAVLPLKNLSGDTTQEYLADGMTEAIIGRLSGIRDCRVISRTSVMRFKDAQLSVPEIAKTLGVDALVEGSVIRYGDRIGVHAQLIRAATDEHFWSESYDQQLRDILSLQSEVTQSIAKKVEVTLTGQEHARRTAARPVSPEVYESYLKGEFGKGNTRTEIDEEIASFGLAEWLMCQGRLEEALAWAQRGRELDPLSVSGAAMGWILFHARRYDEAVRELKGDLAVRPDQAWPRWVLGFVLITKGEAQEAIPLLEKAVSITDRSPGSIELLATAYGRAGRRAEALRLVNELKERRHQGYIPAGAFINPYIGLGDYDEAFTAFARAYKEQSNILQFLKVHPFFDPLRDDPRFKDLLHRVGLDQVR